MRPEEVWVGAHEVKQNEGSKMKTKQASLTGWHVKRAFINVKCRNCGGNISFCL